VTVCGCGHQGRISLKALSRGFALREVFVYDTDGAQARRLSRELADELGVDIEPVLDLKNAVSRSDICVTCTLSKKPFLMRDHVPRGAFVAAVGADSEEKQELDSLLLRDNKVVVDVLEQCALIGELHHAFDAGMLERCEVHAELGEVIAGMKPGRESHDEIIVFDSTGMALQDVVAAAAAYEKAVKVSKGAMINLAG
jgi:ornithine cyclodeaminase/alanine dehydrogenase-like protein (mu-crystallin family)